MAMAACALPGAPKKCERHTYENARCRHVFEKNFTV
jgi:hypothetical protein